MDLSADVLLVTVNSHETQQLFEAFKEIHGAIPRPVRPRSRTYNSFGQINGMSVLHTLCEMGTSGLGSALQAIDESITDLQPHSVIMVGVAFGVSPAEQAIGDVLVSRQLALYEQVRVGAEANIARGDKPHASVELVNYLNNARLYWSEAKVRIGLVLSGEKLVDNSKFRDQILAQEPEAIGGEMEGAGLYAACQKRKVDWILVKGICDWADGNKAEDKDVRQALAARNAARYVATAFQLTPLQRVISPFKQAASPEPQSNLGESENAFIGREALIKSVQAWATNQDAEWILCLHGPGGVGKTRLSKEAGRTLLGHFERLFLVNLESQSPETVTPALLASAIAQVIEPDAVLREPDHELAHLLAGQKTLLILDNFESADTTATQMWLKSFSQIGIKCLVTSRKRWTVRNAAQNIEVERLAIPSSPIENFDSSPAVKLFRARLDSEVALAPYTTLSDSDRVALVRIFQVTEGFPLAIEIVAANLLYWDDTLDALVNDLGVKKLAYRKDLDEYGGGPERHESMGACFQWSLDLLTEDEQERFPKLGVFPYDFSLEAAQEVCGVSQTDLERWWQRSLVQKDNKRDTTRRFLLSLLREYSWASCKNETKITLKSNYARYYKLKIQKIKEDSGLIDIHNKPSMNYLDKEYKNILIASDFAYQVNNFVDFIELSDLNEYLLTRGLWIECIISYKKTLLFIDSMLNSESAVSLDKSYLYRIQGTSLINMTSAFRLLGRYDEAINLGGIFNKIPNHYLSNRQHGRMYNNLANVFLLLEETKKALELFSESLRLKKLDNDDLGIAKTNISVATIMYHDHQYEDALILLNESYEIFDKLGNEQGKAFVTLNRSSIYSETSQTHDALSGIDHAFTVFSELKDDISLGRLLYNKAIILGKSHQYNEALNSINDSIKYLSNTQDHISLNKSLNFCQVLIEEMDAIASSTDSH